MEKIIPVVGRIVHFWLNEDLAASPAVVINTSHTSDRDLLARMKPRAPEGSWLYSSHEDEMVPAFGSLGGWYIEPLEEDALDLLVHGLVRDYRAYGVPFSPDPAPARWSWAPGIA